MYRTLRTPSKTNSPPSCEKWLKACQLDIDELTDTHPGFRIGIIWTARFMTRLVVSKLLRTR